ncbi:MAG: tRNA 2-thiouridine(34) synthase MnmA, partial [Firmicutes bacterium]|nr:tRNA 2-thiouridine(34) synthase MnmA [Bacillota bacterium]
TQDQLAHTLMPVGAYSKDQIRQIAEEVGLPVAHKPDSQEICFVPDGDYAGFIEREAGERTPGPGHFVNAAGEILGEHKGITHYTIGQRKGLDIAMGRRVFVTRICPETNEVVLGENEDLMKREVLVKDFNWIAGEAPAEPLRCAAKTRYRMKEQPATIYALPNGGAKIIFDEPQRAITRGQSAVVYDGDVVLGGGEIA